VDITTDGTGWVSRVGWSDNPTDLTRWVFTQLLGIDPGLMGDVQNYLTSLWCDAPLLDESNSELIYIPTVDSSVITRYRSTGIIDSRYTRLYLLGERLDLMIPRRHLLTPYLSTLNTTNEFHDSAIISSQVHVQFSNQ
jgi:hypothetical protein